MGRGDLKIEPGNSHALVQVALVQVQANQTGPAEDNLKKAIVADPKWSVPVATLAAVYMREKTPQKAEVLLRERQRANPEDVDANVLLVTFLASQKRLGEAEELSRKISAIGEKEPFYRGYLAGYYISTGKPEKSVAEYQRILASHPDDIFNRRGAAALYATLGRANDVQQMIDIILKEKPGDTQVLLIRGQLRLDQGRLDESIQDFQKFLSAEPKSAFGHYLMAEAYTRQGNANQAESQLRLATEIAPRMVQPRMMLGALEMKQGHMDQAVNDLGTAVAEKPAWEAETALKKAVEMLLGQIAEMKGTPNKAIAHYKKVLEIEPDNTPYQGDIGTADRQDFLTHLCGALLRPTHGYAFLRKSTRRETWAPAVILIRRRCWLVAGSLSSADSTLGTR